MDRKPLFLKAQKNEITEHEIYARLAEKIRERRNREILKRIAEDEKRHYAILRSITKQDVQPDMLRVRLYLLLASVFGIAFSLHLMEKGERLARDFYLEGGGVLTRFLKDEQKHEQALLKLLADKRITYAGSIVLGLNDALVELTGVLAGLTFALGNTRLIAITGIITGFAAALSMAASEYLSSREEKDLHERKNPVRGALYTGAAYLVTVAILVAPFLLLADAFTALAATVSFTILIIAFYTFYITTAKGVSFRKRFAEMAAISLGVAAISFLAGMLLRIYFGIDI